ncbi:MAG: ABC-F family ATP-binding cassette domain-containing protein [Bacteroidales bacterium]|nr:ABC-F family ATP-binding cassette domain-containing protein [Bacteroidales bacterium]
MISLNNISIAFNGIPLLKDISFVINKKARIGLTGKNGAGKSTLLKIIYGIQEKDAGSVSVPGGTTMGYLPQKMEYPTGKNVMEEALTAFDKINLIKKEAEKLNIQLSERTDYESDEYLKLIEKINKYEEHLQITGANTFEAETEKTLKGLGFVQKDFTRDVAEFSGGWRMRIELAKLLLQKPDLLLLDEPTNHLDIESIEWLEQLLVFYEGAIIMISHDRNFLDNITKRTVEIAKGKIYDYKAPYTKYELLRKERIEQQLAEYQNQQKMIQETEKFIERFRYKATKAVQVQSRIKQLEKLERIEIDETDISDLGFKFPEAPRSGDLVIDIENMTKSYTDEAVLKDIWLTVERGKKIALVGKNGEGKTTLVRIITGELSHEGKVKIGHNVKIGYFAQNQDKELDDNKTVFETLDDIAVGDVRTKLRSILGNFLFSGEDIDKKVKVLSGGERSRLALAKLMLEPYNLLILDEPTNHLDMHSKDVLKNALKQFGGTILLVSHDRYFLDGLVDEIYEFTNKQIKKHGGDIKYFMKKKRLENLKSIEKNTNLSKAETKEGKTSANKDLYLKRKEFEKEIRKVTKQIDQTEKRIEELEIFISDTEKKLSSGEAITDELFYKKFDKAKKELDEKMYEWEILTEKNSSLVSEKESIT